MPTAAIPAACRSSPSIRATIKQSPMVTTRREGVAVVILVIGYLGDSRTNGAGDWRLMLCQPHVLSYLLRLSRSSATSTIISSWPPTIRRLPSSTRISTALRPSALGRRFAVAQEAGVTSGVAQRQRFAVDTHRAILQRPHQLIGRVHQGVEIGAMLPAELVGGGNKHLQRRIARPAPIPARLASMRSHPSSTATIEFATPRLRL